MFHVNQLEIILCFMARRRTIPVKAFGLMGQGPFFRGWPHRSLSEPLRLLFPIRRARGARGRILLQNIGFRTW